MPVSNYGVLKGRMRLWELPDSGSHAELMIEAAGGPDITAAVNVASQSHGSKLIYYLDPDYQEPVLQAQLSELNPGFHLCVRPPSHIVPSLDLVRTNPISFDMGMVVPHTLGAEYETVLDELSQLLSEAVDDGATLYVFGSLVDGCIVNIHLNQGSGGFFRKENYIAQDGGIIVEFTYGRWVAIFEAFDSQTTFTDDEGQPTGSPLRNCFTPSRSDRHAEVSDHGDIGMEVGAMKYSDRTAELDENARDTSAIRDSSRACQELFAQCQQYSALSGGDWIDQMSAMFNWWSLGIGAEKSGRSSLDHRVRARDDVRDVLLQLLNSLEVSLQNCINIAQDPEWLGSNSHETNNDRWESGHMPGSSAPDEDTELGEQMYYIRSTIEFLRTISTAIRKSGTKFAHQAADSLLPQHAEKLEGLRIYLRYIVLMGPLKTRLLNAVRYRHTETNEQIWRKVEIVLHAGLRDAKRLTPVQERLIHANLIRRNRIDVYQHKLKRRTEKLQPSVTKPPVALSKETVKLEETASFVKSQSVTYSASQLPQGPPTAQTSALSSVSATKLAQSFVLPARPKDGDVASVGTRVSQGVFKQDYPKCPAPEGTNFFCPYCAQLLDPSYSDPKNTRKWRGHIAEDLSPYMCVYPSCDKAHSMYVSTVDLKEHIKNYHSEPRWTCDTCRLESGVPGNHDFHREEDWYTHTTTEHAGQFEHSDLDALAQASQRAAVPPVACPLCYEDTTLLQIETDDHIAEHMHSFALQALPWDDINPDGNTGASVGSNPGKRLPFVEGIEPEEDEDENTSQDLPKLIDETRDIMNNTSHGASLEVVHEILSILTILAERHSELDIAIRDEACIWVLRLSKIFERPPSGDLDPPRATYTESLREDIAHCVEFLTSILPLKEPRKDERLLEMNEEEWDLETKTSKQGRNDYQAYTRMLYAGLASHSLCLRENGKDVVEAHLRLNIVAPEEHTDGVNFRMFFLGHPHSFETHGDLQWQDTQICVGRKRSTKLGDRQGIERNVYPGSIITVGKFCEIISNPGRHRPQLKLAVTDGGLIFEGSVHPADNFLLQKYSISLSELLDHASLTVRTKTLLSYFLAKAVWQFYDSEWMQTGWTKDDIRFMFEHRPGGPASPLNDPFLSVRFDRRQQRRHDADAKIRMHRFPKVLALGIMLLEINLGYTIEKYYKKEFMGADGQPTINTDHLAALEIVDTGILGDTSGVRMQVITTCLTTVQGFPANGDVEAVRDALEKHVVEPLRYLFQSTWYDPDTADAHPIAFPSVIGSKENEKKQALKSERNESRSWL